MAAEPRLDVVIVAYRSRALLGRCLDSLRAHPPEGGLRTIVVDNDSGDGTVEMVASEYPEVELIAERSNHGFAVATNIGISRGSAPYVLALNPDAAVEEGTLQTLLELMDAEPRIGCAGAALYREDGSFDHAARRGFPTPLSALGHFSGLGRRLDSGPLAAYRAPEVERGPVDAVNGAFMLMRRTALEQVGLFDEGYWMYMEDLDLCKRLADGGWITFFEPAARATHSKGGTTGGQRDARLQIAFHRGMGRFYRRHYAPGSPAPLNALIYAGIGLKLAASLLAGALAPRR
jgi:N-acetylglucosaminyl-diphospho-decaprenol L-rhamnosyltransferase